MMKLILIHALQVKNRDSINLYLLIYSSIISLNKGPIPKVQGKTISLRIVSGQQLPKPKGPGKMGKVIFFFFLNSHFMRKLLQ